jgi:hypothetical protein
MLLKRLKVVVAGSSWRYRSPADSAPPPMLVELAKICI